LVLRARQSAARPFAFHCRDRVISKLDMVTLVRRAPQSSTRPSMHRSNETDSKSTRQTRTRGVHQSGVFDILPPSFLSHALGLGVALYWYEMLAELNWGQILNELAANAQQAESWCSMKLDELDCP
jgi:hypothetical protein